MQFADFALRQGDQSHADKGKLFEQARYILLIAGEAIEGLGDKNLEAPGPGILEDLLVTGAQGGGAADGVISVHRLKLPPFLLDPSPALPDLILD